MHQDKISKDVRGTHATASKQTLKPLARTKAVRQTTGMPRKEMILTSQRKDPANKGCNTMGSDVKGRKAVTDGQVSPGYVIL
jgi:hypothetical protein